MKNLAIRTKLAIWYSIMIMVFVSIGFALAYQVAKEELVKQSQKNLLHDGAVIADSIKYNEFRDKLEFNLYDDDEEELTGGIIYSLYSEDNSWLDGRRSAWIDTFPRQEGDIRMINYAGSQWLLTDRVVYHNDNYAGYARILLPLDHIHAIMHKILNLGIISVLPCLILSLVGGMLIAGRALSPVKRITEAAQSIEEGDLSRRINTGTTDDEVGVLAQVFNKMAESLEYSFEREKRFSSDASHELRTPLSVIIAHSESALENDLMDGYRKSMQTVNTKAKEMQVMLARLLMLARGDEQLEISEFNLSDFMEDLVNEISFTAASKKIDTKTSLEKDVFYKADQMLFIHMFSNILENAVKYTEPGGTIRVELKKTAENITVSIHDNGKGISEDKLPHIFERFYRADTGRSAGEGSGLGLSIARRVAELHKGEIKTESSPKGTNFYIILPV